MTRTIFITGSAGGIGLAIARAFSALGDNVVLADLSLASAQAAADGLGAAALAVEVDVRDRASVDTAFAAALRRFGPT